MSFSTRDQTRKIMMDKPPLGARPTAIVAFDRINELSQAIARYSEKQFDVPSIENWADEILLQCMIIKQADSKL